MGFVVVLYLDRPFSGYSCFPLSVSFHQYTTLIFIFLLLLSEGQTGETFEWRNILPKIEEHLEERILIFFFVIRRVNGFIFLSFKDWLWGQHSLTLLGYRV